MNEKPDLKNTHLAWSTTNTPRLLTIIQQLWAGMVVCMGNLLKLNSVFRRIGVLLSFLACLILVSCSNPNEKANEAYVESVTLLKEAEQALAAYRAGSSENPEDFVRKFARAMKNLDRITTKYSRSDLAVKLIQGETKLNGQQLSAYQLRVKQITEAYQSAVAERDRLMKSSSKSPGNFALALVTLTDLPYHPDENTYKNVASMLAKSGEYPEALKFIDDKIANGPRQVDSRGNAIPIRMSCLIDVKGSVAVEMLKRGANDDALRLLEQIQLYAAFINQRDDKTQEKIDRILASFAEHMAKQGRFDEAIKLTQRVVDESMKSSALKDIAVASTGPSQLSLLLTIALEIKEPLPKCRALAAIFAASVANVANGSQELSEQSLNDALTSARSETKASLRCTALNELAQTLVTAKRNPSDVINESLLAAEMLTDGEGFAWKSVELRNIAETIAMSGDIDRAVALVAKLETMQRRVGLTRIADQCAKLGMKERAILITEMVVNEPLKSAIESANLFSAGILARAAEQLSALGQQQRARTALEATVKSWGPAIIAESTKGTNRNIHSLEGDLIEILAQLAALGNLEVALEWAAKLKYHDPFESIAAALVGAGRVDEAVAVVHRSVQQENAFYNVARELAERGHGLEALQLMKDLLKAQRADEERVRQWAEGSRQPQMGPDQRLNPMYVWMVVNVLENFTTDTFSTAESEMATSFLEYANLPFRRDWCRAFVE